MFGKLKEKLKDWTKKISEDKENEEDIEKEEEKLEKEIEESKKVIEERELSKEEEKLERDIEKEKKIVEEKEISAEEKKLLKEIEKNKKIVEKKESKKDDKKPEHQKEKERKKEILKDLKKESKIEKHKPTKKIELTPEKISEEKKETEVKKEKDSEEEPQPGEKGFFNKITSKISKVKITEKEFEIYAEELEMLLLENNVALEVAEKIIKELKEEIVGKELLKKEIESEITDVFKNIIRNILVDPFLLADKIKEKMEDQSKEPYVILFSGINGTGKTTTVAKVAQQLKKEKISCVIAAADTFRSASIEQIKTHGEKLDIKVIANEYGSDPASVGFDAIKYAKKNSIDCVLIDTAGRIHTSKNLLAEIEKISRICKPDTKIFVGESITGNDAVEQVKSFDWEIGIDGIILTKADIDEKGGTALSLGYITKKPILYLGTGQEYEEIEPFDKEKFIQKLGLHEE